MPNFFSLSLFTAFARRGTWPKKIAALGIVVAAIASGFVLSQTASPPLITLSSEPLYMNGVKTKANLTLALSVEFPTVGQTYRDVFTEAKTYVGYFDNKSCYQHVPGNGTAKGAYFKWSGAPNSSGSCGGGGFNGNFMNWATSSAVDILRYGLTGGNRTTDESGGNGLTIVERAWLPDNFYRNGSYFTEKVLPKALVSKMIETSVANKIGDNDMFIYNCRNRVYFAKSKDTKGGCTNPFDVADAKSDQLAGPNNNDTFYEVRNMVCDPNSATNRLMSYDPDTKKWSGLCYPYGAGNNKSYKPVGQFQMNAENLRVAVFGYLQDDSRARYGGVMRAPLKYLGPKAFDANFNLVSGTNPRSEWDANTGVFIANPQSGDTTYGAQGYPLSGAINYINKFGTLDPNNIGKYKGLDPVSELYYEALRYLQGKPPTTGAVSITGDAAAIAKSKENFPVYAIWNDPFAGFQDQSGEGKSCLRNSILTIADVFTHSDRSVPGNAIIGNEDYLRAAETNPALDVPFWTSVVGSFEANSGVSYTDSKGTPRVANNVTANSPYYPTLVNAATMDTGSNGGSYYMAGMAYWANTQSYRSDILKARVKSYSIDVNERNESSDVNFRRKSQLYLAAKYGGFDDSVSSATNPGYTGNPYAPGDNTLWIGADGDAKNYFLVSDAQKFLDSIADVFTRVVEETGSIAGGAISTQRLQSGQAAGVFQARFNPVANYWSGRLLKYKLSVSATTGDLVVDDAPIWEAGDILTKAAKANYGASRKIVIGSPIGSQGTIAPSNFAWTDLAQAHKDILNTTLAGVTDTLGSDRLDYLRGDQRKEISSSAPSNPFRPRDIVLGDIINSGLVYQGKPSVSISGTEYQTFYNANKARTPVVFVNANDGMLHAFNDADGKEAFAYIPGFLAKNLSKLPDQDYSHISMADATPAVAEAKIGTDWRSVLVSGVGGGAQGVFALDVTDPSNFYKNNVLWEFTDRDHPAMGNVIGSPRILKVRTTNSTVTPAVYKWYALVASGVNNYAADGYALASGNPSIFVLDLSFKPSPTAGWVEGTNFWRIELPQTETSLAKGLVSFNVFTNFDTSALEALYAGDLQGNVWKLDFSLNGINGTNLTTDATANLAKFTLLRLSGAPAPMFIAKTADNPAKLQPITGEPVVTNGFSGSKLISLGTGKFLEADDTTVPLGTAASFYTLLDKDERISGRSLLQLGTAGSNGAVITVPPFAYGSPTTTLPDLKMGWYFDFNKTIGERQVSDITTVTGKLFFGSLYPTQGSCGEGGGRLYSVNTRTGNGSSEESQVGIFAGPLVIELGSITTVVPRETSGKRFGKQRYGILTQGSRGMKVAAGPAAGGGYTSDLISNSYLSWRQINNYQENKNKP
jgi:type IV pilus assembly protein PilY1